MADLLNWVAYGSCRPPAAASREKAIDQRSIVGQVVLLDLVAVGLEQHVGAAQLADLLLGPLDHAVALAGLLIQHLPAAGHLEALLGAGLGLELGHLALLFVTVLGTVPAGTVPVRLTLPVW